VVGVARSEPDLHALEEQLGASFTPLVADVTEPSLASGLMARHRPGIVVLNAGAAPHCAVLGDQTWETFSRNWEVDVQQVFHFTQAALAAPLAPGSVVVSFSSGAALRGSPMSGGYAGAKATIRFLSAYAGAEAERSSLGIRFVSFLPSLTPATALGSVGVAAYAEYAGVGLEEFLANFGDALTPEDVAASVVEVVTGHDDGLPAYALGVGGLSPLA